MIKMNRVKKYMGIIWFLLGPAVIFFLVSGAAGNIEAGGKKDINNPVIWIIIIAIFTPVAIGLMVFGWYALNDQYKRLPKKSQEL
jgi:hypothetical protein